MAHIVLRKGRRRQMKVIDHWLEYLTKSRVRFSHSIHPRAETALETATADRMRAHDLAKTVVYITGSGFGDVNVLGGRRSPESSVRHAGLRPWKSHAINYLPGFRLCHQL